MTTRVGNVIVVGEEADQLCEFCGTMQECRPYGPGFKQICYSCGMKDEKATEARMHHKLFDDPLPPGVE